MRTWSAFILLGLLASPALATTVSGTGNVVVVTTVDQAPATATPATPRGLTAGVAQRYGAGALDVGGRLLKPAGMSQGLACTGWIRLTVTAPGHPQVERYTRLRPNCYYRVHIHVPTDVRVSIAARFTGNVALAPVSAPIIRTRS